MNTHYTVINDTLIQLTFSNKSTQQSAPSKQAETLAQMFKRHKVLVPSELIFKYK